MCQQSSRAERILPVSEHAPRIARQFLRSVACLDHEAQVLDDAVLLVSELVTNSLRYGGPPLVVAVDCHADRLEVRVRDGSDELPQARAAGPTAESGRGMNLLATLSDSWGVDPEPDGKRVWFVLR